MQKIGAEVLNLQMRIETMTEFWEEVFKGKQGMWGLETAKYPQLLIT